jgi:flavin-dependent dehydrogenase
VNATRDTITPTAASTVAWDAIVIGAGPAGAFTALHLARGGARTLLVERKHFPRQKVCGGCLNADAIAALHAAGLTGALDDAGARPIASLQVRQGTRRADIPLPAGLSVTRATLDALLVRAAMDASCDFVTATATVVADAPVGAPPTAGNDPGVRTVRLAQHGHAPFTASAKVVVAADGLGHGSLRELPHLSAVIAPDARVGVGAVDEAGRITAPPGTILMAVDAGGYVGVARAEGARVSVAAAFDPLALKAHGSPARAVRAVLASANVAAGSDLDALDWQGTPPLTRRMARPADHRLFVLGDAAGYVEPFTGEGMAWALSTAAALAPLALRGLARWSAALESAWCATHAEIVTSRQRRCRTIARALRSPTLVRAAMAAVSHWPSLARPFVPRAATHRAPLSLGADR